MNAQRPTARFGMTVVANAVRALCAFAGGMLLARTLGTSQYGDLAFLLGSFTAAGQLLDGGTSSAFFTLIAARRRPGTVLMWYGMWLAAQFFLLMVLVGILLPPAVIARLWLGHQQGIVLVACAAAFLTTQLWNTVSQLGESVRRTVVVQAAAVLQAGAHLAILAIGARQGWLSVSAVLWLLIAEYALLVAVLAPGLLRANASQTATAGEGTTFGRELFAYCKPLVPYAWISCLYAFADTWLLQRFGGAVQQGFFAVAQQFSGVSVLLTASVLKVFWKEIAEASERQDHLQVQRLYRSAASWLYVAAAWISALAIPYSRELLTLLAGPAYEISWLCLAIALLYPVHQSLGQVSGTLLYATRQTGTYVRINMVMMLVSIPVTWLVLARLNWGAAGLALKMVVLQWIGVNWQLAAIARSGGEGFGWRPQATALAACLGWGWLCKVTGTALAGAQPVVVGMAIGGLLYLGGSLAALRWWPQLAELRGQLQWLRVAGKPPVVSGT